MPKRRRCITPGVKKDNYYDARNTVHRKKTDRISSYRKMRGKQTDDSLVSLIEPVHKKKKYNNAKNSSAKSKCKCNKNRSTAKRKDVKSRYNTSRASSFSESLDSLDLNHNPNPIHYKNSVITILSSDSYSDDEEANLNSRSKQSKTQSKLNNAESKKYRAIAELEGVKFVTNNPGSTTEISFKPAVVMHVKKNTSTVSLNAERRKSDENIIVVNPSNDLLSDLSAGKVQRLYKSDAKELLRQAVENHSQSVTNVLNIKSSVNFTNLESRRNISQQNAARNTSKHTQFSQITPDSECNVLKVKSSTNFTNLQLQRNSSLSVQTNKSMNKCQEILPPQPIENSINSFVTLETAWRASQNRITRDQGSVVCLTKRDSQIHYGMGDRASRTNNCRTSQHSINQTSVHRR